MIRFAGAIAKPSETPVSWQPSFVSFRSLLDLGLATGEEPTVGITMRRKAEEGEGKLSVDGNKEVMIKIFAVQLDLSV